MKTSSKAQDLQEQLLAKFQAIVDLMDESFTHQEEQKREEAKTFDDFHNSMLERSRYFEDAWDYMSLEISTNTNKIDQSLSETHQKLQLIFDFVDTQFARILTANENLAKIHVQASQSISDDLMMLYQNSKSGQLVLQDILEDNLHKGLQINYLLQDTHLQVENMFEDIEKETRAIVANVTRELKDEALSLFIVFQTTFESTFSQLMFLSQNIGHIIFSMDAASLNLNSSLVILHERVQDLKSINMSSILSSVMLSPKVVSCVLVAICMFQFMFRWEHGQGAFMSAIFFGAFTTYLARSVIFAMFT
ncbi:hypothetical protein METBIDRAFT_33658 [Metschnikowia bicuspidata var. bicuspidata NRRL YB-4993]|uniref:Karyogamy protein 5 n=1 Tax=Metschnikowia bicuspidata var. bicuspidata NRRL YB-4993 TaxID=869754 RepID=A0A1A0H4N6_9ASCO|nr:hypothetical protein METBIDRAFT_33658 [Metschnikowia bicuspidata var. bicuspidata NRRL YB-4993]OBA19039.1 hypothetical protein METBIDRAFT_33658 [Metschnikowia bicuspidata var. bicuspidata NRRL YB-4993]